MVLKDEFDIYKSHIEMLKEISNENNSPRNSRSSFKIDDSRPVKRKTTRKTKSLFSNQEKQKITEFLNGNTKKRGENILNDAFLNSTFYFRF